MITLTYLAALFAPCIHMSHFLSAAVEVSLYGNVLGASDTFELCGIEDGSLLDITVPPGR